MLYLNNGDGSFSEKGLEAGIAVDETGSARAGMGIDAGPVDRNNEVSIFVGNFQDEMNGVFRHMVSLWIALLFQILVDPVYKY